MPSRLAATPPRHGPTGSVRYTLPLHKWSLHSYSGTFRSIFRALKIGIQDSGYSGHSFRRGAAQHASDMGMLDSEIQTLGR